VRLAVLFALAIPFGDFLPSLTMVTAPDIAHRRACAAAGLEGLTLHGLRRSFAKGHALEGHELTLLGRCKRAGQRRCAGQARDASQVHGDVLQLTSSTSLGRQVLSKKDSSGL
jgi:hypothetical protein